MIVKSIREVIYNIIDQELNPACFYDRNLSEIVYYNQALITLFPNMNFLLNKIKSLEFTYHQGKSVELLGTKYDAYIFKIDDETMEGSLITVRPQNRTTLEHYDNKYFKIHDKPGIIINKNGLIETVNEAFEETFGYVNHIIKNVNIKDLFDDFNKDKQLDKISNQIISGKSFTNTIVMIYNSNKQKVKKYLDTVTLYDKDTVIGYYLIFSPVLIELKKDALIDAYQDIVQNMDEAVLITNSKFQLLYANQAYKSLVGIEDLSSYLNKDVSLFIEKQHSKEMLENIWKQLSTNHVWRGEAWISKLNTFNQIVWLEIKSVLNTLGEPEFYVATYKYYSENIKDPSKLYQLVITDTLTGLYNRYYFLEYVSKQLSLNIDKKQYIAFIDLDAFKLINDRYGHMFGDNVLVNIGRIMKKVFDGHIVARYGGDEFVVYFNLDTSLSRINELQNEFLRKLNDFLDENVRLIKVSASIGIAEYPKNGSKIDELISFADQRMYIKKKR